MSVCQFLTICYTHNAHMAQQHQAHYKTNMLVVVLNRNMAEQQSKMASCHNMLHMQGTHQPVLHMQTDCLGRTTSTINKSTHKKTQRVVCQIHSGSYPCSAL